MAVLFWLWFLPMPITTLAVIAGLWRNRTMYRSRVLLLCSLVVLAVWGELIVLFVTLVVNTMRQ